jgi:hypothetical protein
MITNYDCNMFILRTTGWIGTKHIESIDTDIQMHVHFGEFRGKLLRFREQFFSVFLDIYKIFAIV